jgi:Rieske Fe-S protein
MPGRRWTSGSIPQFWIAAKSLWRRRDESEMVRLGSVNDVPVGAARTFAFPTEHDPCVLVRADENSFVAYSQKCTHLSCAVVPHVEEGVIRCPCHEGFFDLASGRPISGPPRRPLSRVRLEVRGGEIFAAGIDERTA